MDHVPVIIFPRNPGKKADSKNAKIRSRELTNTRENALSSSEGILNNLI